MHIYRLISQADKPAAQLRFLQWHLWSYKRHAVGLQPQHYSLLIVSGFINHGVPPLDSAPPATAPQHLCSARRGSPLNGFLVMQTRQMVKYHL